MAILPITEITAGDSSAVGNPSIRNDAQGIIPGGFDSQAIGSHIASDDRQARLLNFDFAAAIDSYSAQSLRFDFGTGQRPIQAHGIDSLFIGAHSVVNAAQLVAANGFDALAFQQNLIVSRITPSLDFPFNLVLSEQTAKNIAFTFGGPLVVASAGIGDTLSIGKILTEKSAVLKPSAIGQYAAGIPTIYDAARNGFPLNLNLSESISGDLFNRFDFGTGHRPITTVGGFDSSRLGRPGIANTAKSAEKITLGSQLSFGSPVIYRDAENIGSINLEFLNSLSTQNAQNVPFYFSVANNVLPIPFELGEVGTAFIWNSRQFVGPSGFNALELSSGHKVDLWLHILKPTTIYGTAFSTHTIYNNARAIKTTGIAAPSVSSAKVESRNKVLAPVGLNAASFGTPVFDRTPEILPGGIYQFDIGNPSIINRNQYVRATSFRSDSYGDNRVEFVRRGLIVSGDLMSDYGSHNIEFLNRTISVEGIHQNFASAHMVDVTHTLSVIGFDAAEFGTRIVPESMTLYPQGFSGQYGLATAFNYQQYVEPKGFTMAVEPGQNFGTTWLYNSRQYITQVYDPDNGLVPPKWPIWTLIENRNKVLQTYGQDTGRVGDARIYNNASPLYPAGIEEPKEPEYYKAGMVSHGIRSYQIEGIEPPYIPNWTTIYNDADVIAPSGFDAALFGVSSVVNTRRYYSNIGNIESGVMGYPMIADAIRQISFESRYSIEPPSIQLPEIKLHTRYIDAIGYETLGIGAQHLEIHWNAITPRWTLQHFFGYPKLHNVTPELQTNGKNTEEFGNTSVRLQWRPVDAIGSEHALISEPLIAHRNRTIYVTDSIDGMTVSDKVKVDKNDSPPYSTQYIWLNNNDDGAEGYGIGPVPDQVPEPLFTQQFLYVIQYSAHTEFGVPTVKANSIRVEPGYQEILFGNPTVLIKQKRIGVASIPHAGDGQFGKPSMSPHTIYAVMEAPDQAVRNHPMSGREYVDGSGGNTPGIVLGEPSIFHKNVSISVAGGDESLFGFTMVELHRHYVIPDAFISMRFGWHEIPGTRYLEQFESSDTVEFGKPKVSRPAYTGPRTIKPYGFTTEFGETNIELFNRNIYPEGYNAALMGTKLENDDAFMWQGLRIGENIPNIPLSLDMSEFGTAWISLRIRNVQAQGFDTFVSEYSLEEFKKRMKVTRIGGSTDGGTVPPPIIPARTIAQLGWLSDQFGTPDIKPAVHYIRPDGNSDQYRKGAF